MLSATNPEMTFNTIAPLLSEKFELTVRTAEELLNSSDSSQSLVLQGLLQPVPANMDKKDWVS